jgi:hypothetical protein
MGGSHAAPHKQSHVKGPPARHSILRCDKQEDKPQRQRWAKFLGCERRPVGYIFTDGWPQSAIALATRFRRPGAISEKDARCRIPNDFSSLV